VFCPSCGEATPTRLDPTSGVSSRSQSRTSDATVAYVQTSSGEHSDYQRQLQDAIGKGYEIRDVIGQGGFGVVYSAWDVELHREVAVKAMRQVIFTTPGMLERFKREARAVARLQHPNIIPIYSVGESENLAYMIMPKIIGESLKATLVREKRLGVEDSRRILIEAARALHTAHEAGIVHRDVKPENILLEGEKRRVYLMDFGIAKTLEGEDQGLTGTGMVIGTPSFMSPEQASGQTIDARSDLYSLGVVAFQMLAGRLP
jgi:serine/threonine protein kinase